jgi:hypothetical protein
MVKRLNVTEGEQPILPTCLHLIGIDGGVLDESLVFTQSKSIK